MSCEGLKEAGLEVREGVPLRDVTTFRLGGPCRCLLSTQDPDPLQKAVRALAAAGEKFVLLGGGSNLLVSDDGLDAVVLRYAGDEVRARRDRDVLEVDACSPLDGVVEYSVEQGLAGLVFMSGIPGTVGGAVVGNAGAYGKQIGDRTESVLLMDRRGDLRWERGEDLGFAYRASRLQDAQEIVVAACLRVEPGDTASLRREREEILQLRRQRHPDWRSQPTAGSFFRNIEPTSAAGRREAAGWFLEQAGAKELRVGGARVFEKHANIIVAGEGCTAREVLELSRRMADAVRAKFGLELVREVRLLGRFE